MSQLPTGQVGPMSGIRMRRGDDRALGSAIPRVGQTGSLGVYGITPDPVDTRSDQQAEALMRSLGIASRGLEIAADESRRQQILKEREDAKAEMADRGLAAQRTLEFGPQLLADVQDGRLTPGEDEDALAFARRVIGERAAIPEDASAAYRAEIEERLIDRVQTTWLARDRALAAEGRRELTELTVDGVAGKDAESLQSAIAEVRRINPNVSEAAATSLVATRSMEYAATLGDRERFNEAASLLPENSVERLKYQNELDKTIDARARDAESAFNNQIAGLYVDIENGEASFDQVRETILASRGSVSEASIDRELQVLNARKESMLRDQRQAALDIEDARDADAVIEGWTSIAADAFNTGGLSRVPEEITWENSAGEKQRLGRNDIIAEATERRFSQIDQSGLPPEQAIVEKTAFLADNGVKYEPWSRVMKAGYLANVQAFTAMRANGERVTKLPANLRDGYDTFKMVQFNNPAVAAMHTDEQTRQFYQMAMLAEQYVDKGQPEAALLRAVNASGNRPVGAISDKAVMDRATWVGNSFNAQDKLAEIRDVADLYLGSGVVSDPETAIKRASETVKASHRKINGAWVNVSDRNVPPNIEDIAKFAANEYAAQFPEDELDAKHITLKPGMAPGTWEMIDRRSGLPVERVGRQIYTDSQLAEIDERRRESVRAEVSAMQESLPARQEAARDGLAKAIEATIAPIGAGPAAFSYNGSTGMTGEILRPAAVGVVRIGDALGKKFSANYVRPVAEALASRPSWYEKREGETEKEYRLRTRRRGGLD